MARLDFTPMGLGFLLAVAAACGTPQTNAPSSEVANNGEDTRTADYPAVVMILNDGFQCSGSVVSSDGLVLTAGHCVVKGETSTPAAPSQVQVIINGVSFGARSIAIHESYLLRNENERDLAVIRIDTSGASLPAPLKLSAKPPERGATVTVAGYGVPTQWADVDEDGVANDFDHCTATPSFLSSTVEKSGDRSGCASGETAEPLPGVGVLRDPNDMGTLRVGTNTLSGLDPKGILRIQGPFTTHARAGQVTPGGGDSGGPLMNAQNEIVGTVEAGGPLVIGQSRIIHEAYFVDINHADNRSFLKAQGIE